MGAVRPPAPAATDGDERPRRHQSHAPPALPLSPLAATIAYCSRRSLAPAPRGTVCAEGTRRARSRAAGAWGVRRGSTPAADWRRHDDADRAVAERHTVRAAGLSDGLRSVRKRSQHYARVLGRFVDSATKGAREEDRSPQAARDCARCTVRPACTDGRRGRARARGLMPVRRMAGHAIGTRLLSLAG